VVKYTLRDPTLFKYVSLVILRGKSETYGSHFWVVVLGLASRPDQVVKVLRISALPLDLVGPPTMTFV
jgi:hypothetical protein